MWKGLQEVGCDEAGTETKRDYVFFNGKEDKGNQMGTVYFYTDIYYVTGYESSVC